MSPRQNREKTMSRSIVRPAMFAATLALACAAPVSIGWAPQRGPSITVDRAEAVVGRPATPGSVAGVARRQTRRAVRHCAAGLRLVNGVCVM
jgi:hypothetical protein